jgi:serine/threonine protein kinase
MNVDPQKARSIFLSAVEKFAPEQWQAHLDKACGADQDLRHRVEVLLRAHEQANSLLDALSPNLSPSPPPRSGEGEGGRGSAVTLDEPVTERPGTVIGPYKLLEQIGEGGFGVVFMAEQTHPVRRRVALKVLKPGMDTRQVIARFEAERQALAIMDHPNIAKVFDGGATASGRPYFVMELVRGVPVTDYCDENHLTPRQRLELFLPVCQAVQHAHQKGIIHRDLKPSNILVTMHDTLPVPKVIDFGVAKALGQELTDKTLFTGFAQMIGTPLYMSPEQAGQSGLDIDTRSDIYSLGVLLYELLTGTTPFTKERFKQAAYDEIRRIIREEEPPKPSTRLSELGSHHAPRDEPGSVSRSEKATLASISALRQTEPAKLTKLLRGELDWIVMKCLEKDRNRRYETANGLAIDLQRYLADEPVQAGAPSRWYRFRKYARRNKAGLAIAAAVVLVMMLAVVGLAVNNWLVTREKEQKEAALERVVQEKERADRNLAAARRAVRDYLTTTANDPRLRAADLLALRRNLLATAVPFFEEFAAQQAGNPEAEGERAQVIMQLALVREEMGETEKARAEYDRARSIFAELAAGHPQVHKYREALAVSQYNLGNALEAQHRTAEAEAAYRQALAVIERLRAEVDKPGYRRHLAAIHTNLGAMFSGLNKHREAAGDYRRAIAILEKLVDEVPSDREYLLNLASARGNLANAFNELGEDDQALALYRQAIAAKVRLVELDRTNREYRDSLAMSQNNLGTLLEGRGDRTGAEAAYREARTLWAQLAADFRGIPDYRHQLAQSYFNRGNLLRRDNQPVEAMAAYRQAVGILETLTGEFPGNLMYQRHLGWNANRLGLLLLDNDQPAEAEAALRTALAIRERLVAAHPENLGDAVDLGGDYVNLGIALQEGKRPQAALEWYGKAVATLGPLAERKPPPDKAQWFLRNAHGNRAKALMLLKRYTEALPDWDRSFELSAQQDRWTFRLGRMEALARSGDHALATAEANAAAEAENATALTLYEAACVYALSAAAARESAPLAERYSARAVALLRQAIEKDIKVVSNIGKEERVDSLRSRPDFQKLMQELKERRPDSRNELRGPARPDRDAIRQAGR